ncbi:hypothetical protein AA0119_g12889 [Alternaria tenuissima]|uniref:Major facilitator superfamily (MFS) profile domain-containing protein n=1 Tax=Alternaria tenuissima TaxID=119927 RepID=A0AB37VZL4_9PLEO|nr:hypothetical protein AA0115_g12793 [Alternaria tenuissima]RYN86431.1 hypothetical protein AA0119_g12889 [Alternaria tenuissima]RYO03561.1 hypothetical protein AA0121_g13043 [Alternaria tenuissima]
MADLSHTQTHDAMLKNAAHLSEDAALDDEELGISSSSRRVDFGRDGTTGGVEHGGDGDEAREQRPKHKKRRFGLGKKKESYSHTHYKVYKRRWIGLGQLVLLNIVVSWDWLTFAPISTTSSQYFNVLESTINWLSTAFLFAFAVSTPLTIYLLHRGPKPSIIAASILLLAGNWIRYAGTKTNVFSVVMVGQILTGLAQPFVLAAPTRYSDMWFTEGGRVGATALASLANPFGAALASLINPFLGDVPTTVLIVSCIATAACIPSFFIPASPPSPPSASSAISKTPVSTSLRTMLRTPSFYLVFSTFGIYTGFFNAFTSLLNQILYPYGYTEDEAGICGAVLIVVGLVACAITSPIADKTHAYLLGIKILCPILSAAYLAMIWAPQTRSIAAPYVLSAVLGACSFSLLPIALEYLVEISFPASPEVSSTICWVGGQVFGGIFIVVMNELKDGRPVDLEQVQKAGRGQAAKGGDRPPGHMFWALVFQAVVCALVLPLPLMLGVKRLGFASREGRLKKDVDGDSVVVVGGAGERGDVEVNGGVAGAER